LTSRRIGKLLVANRGEIAVRVIRACREAGIVSVAVFSEADREALHVLMADEAYPIGPPPAAESYLAIEKLVAVAKKAGADAVHPGYGFLAENAAFAEACAAAGLTFVGPPPAAIVAMGDKTAARRIARDLGVPMVAGTLEAVASDAAARAAAREIGYPLMIKAALASNLRVLRIRPRGGVVEFSASPGSPWMRGITETPVSNPLNPRANLGKTISDAMSNPVQSLCCRKSADFQAGSSVG